MPFQFLPPTPMVLLKPLPKALAQLGLTNGLQLVLDAGDSDSVAIGTQSKWLDVSGNGYDFFRGADGTSSSTDPTFNGTPGGLSPSEYWSCDGGDYFRYDTSNETWMNNLHKAGTKFTMAFWVRPVEGGVQGASLMGTTGSLITGTGVLLNYNGDSETTTLLLRINNAGSQAADIGLLFPAGYAGSAGLEAGFIGISYDSATGVCVANMSGASKTTTVALSSPSSSSASYTMEIGAFGNANSPMGSGARLLAAMMWSGVALSSAQLSQVFAYTRDRFALPA